METIANIVTESLNINRQQIEPCLLQIDYTLPSDKADKAYDRMAIEFAKYSKVPGFRPGKAPVSLVKTSRRKEITEETIKELVSNSIKKSMTEETDVLSYTFVKDKTPEIKTGNDFSFSLRFNVAPEIEVPEYKGIKIEVEKAEISEEDVDKKVEQYKDLYGKYEKVDGTAENGDIVKVSYTSDAVLPEDAKENVKRIVNSDYNYIWTHSENAIPKVETAVLGKKAGEKVQFTAEFPANFDETTLAGKTVNYEIEIKEVQRKTQLKSDEEFCSKFGVKTIEEARELLKKSLSNEINVSVQADKKAKVMAILSKDLTFPIPPDMLNEFTNNELNNMYQTKIKEEKDADKVKKEFEEKKEALIEEAKTAASARLRSFLLLRKIGKIEKLTVTESDIDGYIRNVSYYYGHKPEDLKKNLVDSGNIDKVVEEIFVSKVADFIADKAEVTFVTKQV